MGLATYLTFDGKAEEAMNFYAHALGVQLNELHRFRDMPESGLPEEFLDRVMHCNLTFDGTVLMASDAHPQMGFDGKHAGFSVSVNVQTPERADTIFNALSEGANVIMPMGETSWAARFGMLADKYGIGWMVNCDHAPDISY